MNIKNRLEKLEQHTGAGKQIIIWMRYEGDDEPTEAQKESALADYKAKNPDWEERDVIVLRWSSDQFQKRG